MGKKIWIWMTAAAGWISLAARPAPAQIADGSFESGEYAGWLVVETPTGQGLGSCGLWGIVKHGQTVAPNDRLFDFSGPALLNVSTPGLPATFHVTEGRFAAIQLQQCVHTTRRMSQKVALAPGAATLRWDMRYRNHHVAFVEGVQDIQVTVRDVTTGAVLPGGLLFRTTEGADPQEVTSMTPFSAGLSAFAGQTVEIAFDVNAAIAADPFRGIDIAFDNVRVHDASGDEIPGDGDADGLRDGADNCPSHANPGQSDYDGDGVGDVCDNCGRDPNPGQENADGDGIGDACDTGRFRDGDLYFLAFEYPLGHYLHDDTVQRAVVKLDPFTGQQAILHAFESSVSSLTHMTYDPHRDVILLKQSATVQHFFHLDAQGRRTTVPFTWPHDVRLWTPAGDGRIYMVAGGEAAGAPFGYLDESGASHDLLAEDGSLLRADVRFGTAEMLYDLGTDSLFTANTEGRGTRFFQVPLSPDGARIRAPVQSFFHDAHPTGTGGEIPRGMSAGPRGTIFVNVDTPIGDPTPLLFTLDPVTLESAPFALLTPRPLDAGTYNGASGRAIGVAGVIQHPYRDVNPLKRFLPGGAVQSGETFAEIITSNRIAGVHHMISIGDTINRSYRLTLELDGLRPGGAVYGIAGERIRLHGTAFLRASHPGVTAWDLGIRGAGAGVAFGFESCDPACASRLVFFGGEDQVATNAPAVVDPDLVPGAGPLAGSPQGPGLVDRVELRSGVELGSRRVKVLRFWVEVTVPAGPGGEEVQLSFGDGLVGGGPGGPGDPAPVLNSVRHADRTVTADQGIFLGDLTFRVKDADLLALPAAHEFTLTPAEPLRVFRLAPPAAKALRLRLLDADPLDANALYVSQGRSLIPGRFELAADERLQANQRLAVWTLRPEPVFVECRGTAFAGGQNALRLEVEGKEIALESLSARRGSGVLTASIQGAGFATGVAFTLVPQAGGSPLPARETLVVSAGRAEASFLLDGAPGLHDLRVQVPSGASDVLQGAFELVERRVGPVITAQLTGPRACRYNRLSRLTLAYRNDGDEEASAPLFKVVGPPGVELRLEGEPVYQAGELLVLGIHPDGVPGKLPPGGEGTIPIIFRLDSCPPCPTGDPGCPTACEEAVQLFVLRRSVAFIDWGLLAPPGGMGAALWANARPGLESRFGETWQGYAGGLARVATRLARRGAQAASVHEAFRFAVRDALGRPSGAVTGRLTRVESGLPLAGVTVAARRGGAVFSSAVADPLGDFALDWLAPWETHELVVADHAVVAAPGGVATFTLVPGEDRHQFDIAAEPSPNGLVPGNAGRDESGLPAAPLFPPGSLFDLVTERPLRVVNSWDPNDKNGNDDLGDPVPPDEELEYTVYFENEAGKASGPAQEIVITDQLDPAKFDLTTFEVRDVRLGNLPYQFAPLSHQGFEQASGYTTSPSSRRSFGTDTFPVRTVVEDQGEVFEFDQEIAVSWELEGTGRAVWRLETDSTEALVGVLPVNDAEKGGEGHVSFAVKPLPGLAAGSELENQAQIRFDDNPLITTRTWVNVIALPQPPAAPAYPRPADGAGGVEASVVLQWQSSGDSFDVFLWREGQTKPAVPEAVAAPHFKPAALAPGTSYLWQVTARNGQGSAAGPTWRFSAHQDPPFVRGDANADGAPNIADASHLLDHLFAGGAAPSCRASADANADGVVDVSDAIRLLLALFVTGAPLPPPYPACGVPAGPEAGVLSCRSFPGCP